MPRLSFTLSTVLACAALARAKSYDLLRYNGGANFFDAFTYFGDSVPASQSPLGDILNNGDDFLANHSYAQSAGLTSINSAGNAIIKVDDTSTVVFNQKRYSVRIDSNELYGPGNVFVLDLVHLPFGCSVWPAYWTTALEWPKGGEIDIIENVNRATNNQMALHTNATCTIETSGADMTGSVVNGFNDCTFAAGGSGCVVRDPSTQSFGQGFNDAQGGMWVTEFATSAISMWFFSRADIPTAISTATNGSSIDPSTLGVPVAHFPSANCDISTLFEMQKIVFDISLCGNFAGAVFNATCTATRENSCYLDVVLGPPSGYSEAYFEIASLRIFNDGTPDSFTGTTTSGTGPSTTAGGAASSGGSGTQTGGGSTATHAAGGATPARHGAATLALGAFGAVALWAALMI